MDRMKTSTERDITSHGKDTGFQNAALYSICNKQYLEGGDKRNHYCHITGEYKGAA